MHVLILIRRYLMKNTNKLLHFVDLKLSAKASPPPAHLNTVAGCCSDEHVAEIVYSCWCRLPR